MQIGVMLRIHGGKSAAAGWDGDQFVVFEDPDQRLGLVWLSTWDSDDEAREFARAYTRFQTTKLGDDAPEPEAFPDSSRRTHQGAVFAVQRRDSDVAVVEGFDAETTDRLLEAALKAKKTEMTRPPALVENDRPAERTR
jgi:hypothetical protein